MTEPRTEFLEALSRICGTKSITTDAEEMEPWLIDWRGRFRGAAFVMASPSTAEEVSHIVALAANHHVPIVPQGGNSGMVGGATPDSSGDAMLMTLRRMSNIRSIDKDERQITADAGVVLQNLHEAVSVQEMRFPLTLGGKGSATVGGLVSTNAGGTQVLRHGTMRSLVCGIEAVLPDGSIYNDLQPLKKDNRGYDLKQLLIGGEGTLGVVTAATLKLVPALIDRTTIWAGVASTANARALLLYLQRRANRVLEGFEILPQACLKNVLNHIPGTRAPLESKHHWHVLIELVRDEPKQEPPPSVAERLMGEALELQLIENAAISTSEAQSEAFWKLRDSIAEAERTVGPAVQHDISVPVDRMDAFIDMASSEIERAFPGTQTLAFGHMGDGNVHFHVMAPHGSDDPDWPEQQGRQVSAAVYDLVVAWDGSISAEHGIGQLKRNELLRLCDPVRMHALEAIKRALDPKGIMNPGKLITPRQADATPLAYLAQPT